MLKRRWVVESRESEKHPWVKDSKDAVVYARTKHEAMVESGVEFSIAGNLKPMFCRVRRDRRRKVVYRPAIGSRVALRRRLKAAYRGASRIVASW